MIGGVPFCQLVAFLAVADEPRARRYILTHPRANRSLPKIRATLAEHIHPEVMAALERANPWLLSDDDGDDTRHRIREALREAGTAGLNRAQLQARLQRVPVKERDQALEGLVGAMEVHIEHERTRGRLAHRYRLAQFAHGIASADEMRNPFSGWTRPLTLEPLD